MFYQDSGLKYLDQTMLTRYCDEFGVVGTHFQRTYSRHRGATYVYGDILQKKYGI